MSSQTVVLWAAICAGAGLVLWRYTTVPAEPAARVGVLYDRSLSQRDGCEAVEALARQSLRSSRTGSVVSLFATGDKGSAYEPALIVSLTPPFSTQVMEGQQRQADMQQKFVNALRDSCGKLAPTDISPVFLGVKQAIEQLRSQNTARVNNTYLYVVTDLEENVDPKMKRALHNAGTPAQDLPPPIDNAGVHVAFCGYAETRGEFHTAAGEVRQLTQPRNAEVDIRLRAVWTHVFTEPGLVSFEPFCPRADVSLQ